MSSTLTAAGRKVPEQASRIASLAPAARAGRASGSLTLIQAEYGLAGTGRSIYSVELALVDQPATGSHGLKGGESGRRLLLTDLKGQPDSGRITVEMALAAA